MKKSTLLSLLTAGAVIATSAGTFAAWDTTEATSSGELSFDSPVTIATTSTPTDAVVSGVDVTFKKGSTDLTTGVDKNVTDAANSYTVTITPTSDDATEALTKALKVEVTGTLENATVAP